MHVLLKKEKQSEMQQIHHLSGMVLSGFIVLHFINHIAALGGPDAHIQVMEGLRIIYRNPFSEFFLLLAVASQVVTGGMLMFSKKFWSAHVFDKLQILAGLYLAFFLLYHVGVVLVARTLWEIDTNFYFAAAGVGKYPSNLFFIPYYSLSVVSVFVHVACVHRAKTMEKQGDKKATRIAYSIIGAGGMIAATIIFTMI